MRFSAFTDRDFDAYLERKWRSNAFNRERLEVKQKLTALGRALAPALSMSDGTPLSHEVSVEYPALWNQQKVPCQDLYFSRDAEARRELDGLISRRRTMAALIEDPSPLRNHVFLSVRINHEGVEVGVKVHADASVDRDNLARKCQEFFLREKLVALLRSLPDGYRVGLTGEAGMPAAALTDERLSALVSGHPESSGWLGACRSFARDLDETRSEAFAGRLEEELARLLPVFRFIAWSRDNDHLGMRQALKERQKTQESLGLQPNDRVRVKKGIFAGKTGEVEEVQPKGKVKVRFGTISIQMNSTEVERC